MKYIYSFLLILSVFSIQAQRVLVIGIDGTRSDALTAAFTPNIDALIAEGVYSPDALNNDITSSGPGWSDILTGVRSNKHGVTDNSFAGSNYANYPTFLKRLETSAPELNTVSICQWAPINDYIVTNGADVVINVASGVGVRIETVDVISNSDPHAIFIHFDDVDYAGHSTGFSPLSPTYIAAIEEIDLLIGEIISALYSRVNYDAEDWAIILTPDHGGLGYSHGGISFEEQNVFFIASGPSIPTELIEKTLIDSLPAPVNCLGGVGTSQGFELTYQGDGGHVIIPNAVELNFGATTDFSIEFRVRTYTTPDVAMLGNKDWNSGLNPGFVFSFEYPNGPAWKVNIGDGSSRADANASVSIADGQWHTLSATFDRDGLMKLYTDGVFDVSTDISGVGNCDTWSGISLGADIFDSYAFSGTIAEVRIFHGILNAGTISNWSCASLDISHPNWASLKGYWKIDDVDSIGSGLTLTDYSYGGNDAAVEGGVWASASPIYEYDYTQTPRLEDVAVTAMTHMCLPIESGWYLDGVSWVAPCVPLTTCPEDVSQNGIIDIYDVLAILADYGCISNCTADVDGDGFVTTSDVLALLAMFGSYC